MKTVAVRMKIPAERRLEIYREIISSISFARCEEGCRRCSFTQSIEDENENLLLEEWENFERLENHLDCHLYGLLDRLSHLLMEPWEMTLGSAFMPQETERTPGSDCYQEHHDEAARRALERD